MYNNITLQTIFLYSNNVPSVIQVNKAIYV